MNQPIVAQLSTKLSTGQLFIMMAQRRIKNGLAIFWDGAYQCRILVACQKNSAIYQIKLFFNARLSNLIEKIWLQQDGSDKRHVKILTDLSTTMFHVELA